MAKKPVKETIHAKGMDIIIYFAKTLLLDKTQNRA